MQVVHCDFGGWESHFTLYRILFVVRVPTEQSLIVGGDQNDAVASETPRPDALPSSS